MSGPGTELKRIFSSFFIVPRQHCPCHRRADLMDLLGPRWCAAHIDDITDWLEDEYNTRVSEVNSLVERLKVEPDRADEIRRNIESLGIARQVGDRYVVPSFCRPVASRLVWIAVRRCRRQRKQARPKGSVVQLWKWLFARKT